jgi:hypothetical protein
MTKAIAKAETPKVPATGFAAGRFDTGKTGLENVTSKDLLIPRLTILQALSPQCVEGKPEYREELRPGMIYDTGLSEHFNKELGFVPVHFDKQWIEWAPRETGKGLINIYDNDDIMAQTEEDINGRDALPNGNYIVETAQIYGLNLNAKLRPSFIALTGMQLKKARRWLTLATSEEIERPDGTVFQAPFYYRSYKLTTTPESNAKGNWVGWVIDRARSIPEFAEKDEAAAERLFTKAISFKESIDAGLAKADTSTLDDGAGASAGGKRGGSKDTGQEM